MTTTDPRARLDEIKARADAATEGPWTPMEYDHNPGDQGVPILGGGERGSMAAHLTAYTMTMNNVEQTEADAEFVAHARTDLPAMAAALTAVLKLHVPYMGGGGMRQACDHCTEVVGEHCNATDEHDVVAYPCPTVTAITNALGGDRG